MNANQFTLRDLFAATAVVALACLTARYAVAGDGEPMAKFYALASVPILLCAAVGVLRRRVGAWIKVGVGIDIAFGGLILFRLMMQI
jgi:hypothetical protein